jgi:hypothetical protein
LNDGLQDSAITRNNLVDAGSDGIDSAAEVRLDLATGTGLDEVCVGAATGSGDSTNAMGSSNVAPGRLLVRIETCPSSIGDSLDMLTKSSDCLELSSSSILDIHRMMDAAV